MKLFPWFDCLRCLAVVLVMVTHSPDVAAELPPGISFIFGQVRQIGWVGVDLFFVLSGFLVSGLLFQEYDLKHTIDIKRFLIRRGFKILPSLYMLVAVTAVFQIFAYGHAYKIKMLDDLFFCRAIDRLIGARRGRLRWRSTFTFC